MLPTTIVTNSRKDRRQVLTKNEGFALPVALALGMVMLAFAGTSILVAQNDRNDAAQRHTSGASILVSDGAVARVLMQLSKPENGVLLVRDYDPINPKTGKHYLGADSIANSGDEGTAAIDEWTGYNPSGASCFQQVGRGAPNMTLTGAMSLNETYTIRAYRYDKSIKQGTLLVEGNHAGQSSLVAVTLSIEPVLNDFPGVFLRNFGASDDGKLALRNRSIFGSKSNVYYSPSGSANPSLTGTSAPGDATRASYLSAIWSGPSDGATSDTVEGKLFACRLTPSISVVPQGTNLGSINTILTLSGSSSGITHYQVQNFNLNNNQTFTVDTTAGPVYLYIMGGASNLQNNAKILNIRTDGQPPQVGDLRIMSSGNSLIRLSDQSCIQNAFVYLPIDQLEIFTTGSGCPGGKNTNFEGVAWVEELLFSKNAASNRDVILAWTNIHNTTITPSATSGIAVPDDVTSLTDLLEYIDWPAKYKYGAIKNWQRVN